jgi:hypothetical protein
MSLGSPKQLARLFHPLTLSMQLTQFVLHIYSALATQISL